MWTPKRVLLLAAGFVVFLVGYQGYAHFLGGIDGLPPLPAALLPPPPGGAVQPTAPRDGPGLTTAEQMLLTAFGAGAAELKRPYLFGSSTRGTVMAFHQFAFEKDGLRLRLQPIGLGLFSKAAPGKHPEINTLRADVAYLTFDRPISGIQDISARKIVAAELSGRIEIVHNRRTPRQDDDIDIYIDKGTVLFDDAKRLISTGDVVRLTDMQSKPRPMVVTATGLDVYLTGSPSAGGRPAPGAKGDKDAAVERLVLRSNVHMNLFVAPGSSFPGLATSDKKDSTPPKPGAEPPANDPVTISTAGSFQYHLAENRARFDVPENSNPAFPERVEVVRKPGGKGKDVLTCEHLLLQFRRKPPRKEEKPPADAAGSGDALEIETAHATGRSVDVKSEAELLDAHGDDLFHDARTATTTLKDKNGMWLLKKGNEVHAREMELVNVPGAPKIAARGPGRVHLLDEGGKRYHARWKESFSSVREGGLDVLTLRGDAAFAEDDGGLDPRAILDDARLTRCKTLLKADTLQVWLEPRQPATAAATPVKPGGSTATKPRHVEATGNVAARTAEVIIRDTGKLVLTFAEAPPALPPPVKPVVAGPVALPPPTPPVAPVPAKVPRPLELTARYVTAKILRSGAKNDLDKLHTEGAVHVTQAPSGPNDKGVDIKGSVLDLERRPGGNLLTVRGLGEDVAELHLDKLVILGPAIEIDQATNHASVDGKGYMRLESKTDFQGNALTKPVPLDVFWDRRMDFDGDSQAVDFHGNVNGSQEEAKLRCNNLHVTLDRPVSLKEGNRGGPSPHARKLTADGSVFVEERTLTPAKALAGFQRLDCLELNALTEEGEVRAAGPGWLRMVQPGGDDLGLAPPAAAPKGPAAWRLTLVNYSKIMVGDNKKRTARFDGNVTLLYVGWDPKNYLAEINVGDIEERLPRGGLYMTCESVTVYAGKSKGAKDRTLDAFGVHILKAVDARDQVLYGSGEEVHFDEEKDQIILDGKLGTATLTVVERKGTTPKKLQGKKIVYSRKTGRAECDGVVELSGTTGGR